MYNVYSFLEPLGLISPIPVPVLAPIPTPSQEPVDPWANRFPPDRQTYKLHDEEDDTYRCPCCLHELEDNSCSHCDAEFSGSDDDDEFGFGGIEFEEDDVVNGIAGGFRRRGARVNIAHVQDVLGTSEDDGPAGVGGRVAGAGRQNNDNNHLGEQEDQGMMVDSASESDSESGSSQFIRRRPDAEILHDSDDHFLDSDAEDGSATGDRDRDFRASPIARRRQLRERNGRHLMIDSEAEDDDNEEHEDDIIGIYGGERDEAMYDSEEDDGSVPRIMYTRPQRQRQQFTVVDDNDEDEDSQYESSFINDEDDDDLDTFLDDTGDEDGLGVGSGAGSESGSNDTENENDADQMIQLGSSDHDHDHDHESRAASISEEEREEVGAGQVPNIQEMRRRRLEALANARR